MQNPKNLKHFTIPAISGVNKYRELKQRRRQRQREQQKNIRFRWAKQLCTCSTRVRTFLCRRCTTATWNFLISRFVYGERRHKTTIFSFSELGYIPLEFNSRKIRQHLTNWGRWKKSDDDWNRANSFFTSRFRFRRRLSCLIFLLTVQWATSRKNL